MKTKKKILRVIPSYLMISAYCLVLICVFVLILGILKVDGNVKYPLLWYLPLVTALLISLFFALVATMVATVNEQGIKIYMLFICLAEVKWSEIYSIREEKLKTAYGRSSRNLNFLVIRTAQNQWPNSGGKNKKNTPPWQIISTERNRKIIEQYSKIEYNPTDVYIKHVIKPQRIDTYKDSLRTIADTIQKERENIQSGKSNWTNEILDMILLEVSKLSEWAKDGIVLMRNSGLLNAIEYIENDDEFFDKIYESQLWEELWALQKLMD